jgi:hypothetical protein
MQLISKMHSWAGVVLLVLMASSGLADDLSADHVTARLDLLKTNIAAELTVELQRTNLTGSYTVVWRAYEDSVITALERILPAHIPGLTTKQFDAGKSGREKNRLADFAIVCGGETIEVSVKTARNSGQPENDMGTFRDHDNRRKMFSASFTVWVRYEDKGGVLRADRVFFDRTWRFTGKSSLVDGVKYRKKDGNMRPKPWAMFESGDAFWKTQAEFESAVKRSEIFRANELIKEYLDDLSESDQRLLYEKLKPKFRGPVRQ